MQDEHKEIEVYSRKAEDLQVKTPEQMTVAESILTELRRRKKVWLEAVEASVKTAHAAWKAAVAHRDAVAKPIAEAERIVKGKIADYAYEQRRIAAAEQARLQAEADAKADGERRRALVAAAKLKTTALRERRQEEAEAIVAPVVNIAPKVPETKLSMVISYSFEIVNAAEIPAEYMIPDEKKIGAVVRATKGAITIPGVKVIKRESVR